MEMKLEGNEFWLLDSSDDKRIYDNLDDAVKSVKSLMESDVDTDNMSLVVVTFEGDNWSIKQVPWSEIAVKLVKVK